MQVWQNFGFRVAYVLAALNISPSAGALSVTGYAPSVSQSSGSAIAPAITASQTSGTAPLPVYFDASATTASTLTSLPFHELLYIWDFGDTTGTYWAYGAKAGTADKNIAYGPQAAHVFLGAGTKTVTLTVIHISSGGTISTNTTTQNITITAESTTYPDSSCYYIDSVSPVTPGSGGVPAASTGIQTGDMDTATAARTTANRMFYLKCGGTYNFGASLAVQKQGIRIRAYGSGAAPIITFTSYDSGFVLYDGANDASNFQWHDCKFDGVSTNAVGGQTYKNAIQTQTSLGGSLKNVLVRGCEATTCGGLFASTACDGVFMFENNLHDLSGGGGDVGMYHQYGSRVAIIGNAVVDCYGIEHNIRIQGSERGVINNNTLRQAGGAAGGGKQIIAIRGYSNQASGGDIGTWSGIWTEKWVVSDNSIDGGSNGTGLAVQFAPQNTGANERIRDIICENNVFTGDISQPIGLEICSGGTVRNNLIYTTHNITNEGNGLINLYSQNSTSLPVCTSLWIYNNSGYATTVEGVSMIVLIKNSSRDWATGVTMNNNLCYAPNATKSAANYASSGSNGTFHIMINASNSDGETAGYYTASNNSSNSQMKSTVPGFTIPPTSTLTTWKPTSGYAINGGVYISGSFADFFNAQRTGTPDMGGVNP